MSEENQKTEEVVQQEKVTDEIVEISWEEVSELVDVRRAYAELENHLAGMLLTFEKQKVELLKRSSELESKMFDIASALKDANDIDPRLTYEIKLPQQEGEKAYFIRKNV